MNTSWRSLSLLNPAFVVALLVMTVSALGMSVALRLADVHLQKEPIQAPGGRTLLALPRETESWKQIGGDKVESADVVDSLGTENYVTRAYVEKHPADPHEPVVIEFHAAYYTGMIDTVPHVPERCFVGGGMQIGEASRVVPIPLRTDDWVPDGESEEGRQGRVFTTRLANNETDPPPKPRVRLPRDVTPDRPLQMRVARFDSKNGAIYSGYFFIANGGTVASAEQVRLLAFNLTDDYAYYLKVQFNSAAVGSAEELAEIAGRLLDELLGEVMRCAPDWADVQQGLYPPDNPRRASGPTPSASEPGRAGSG